MKPEIRQEVLDQYDDELAIHLRHLEEKLKDQLYQVAAWRQEVAEHPEGFRMRGAVDIAATVLDTGYQIRLTQSLLLTAHNFDQVVED